jgi:hypothetical protein
MWLKDYTAQHLAVRAAHPLPTSASSAPEIPPVGSPDFDIPFSATLALSFSRAKQTFFERYAPFELNISSQGSEPFLLDVSAYPHPPPEAFENAEKDIRDMMRGSLQRFTSTRTGNSGAARATCGIMIGVSFLFMGLAPVFTSVFGHHSRFIRLVSLPFFFFGVMLFLTGFRGVSHIGI